MRGVDVIRYGETLFFCGYFDFTMSSVFAFLNGTRITQIEQIYTDFYL
jgi:hypothetical protein